MANRKPTERVSQIVSMEERLAMDPRASERLTIVGGMMFRLLEVPKPDQKASLNEEREE